MQGMEQAHHWHCEYLFLDARIEMFRMGNVARLGVNISVPNTFNLRLHE